VIGQAFLTVIISHKLTTLDKDSRKCMHVCTQKK